MCALERNMITGIRDKNRKLIAWHSTISPLVLTDPSFNCERPHACFIPTWKADERHIIWDTNAKPSGPRSLVVTTHASQVCGPGSIPVGSLSCMLVLLVAAVVVVCV